MRIETKPTKDLTQISDIDLGYSLATFNFIGDTLHRHNKNPHLLIAWSKEHSELLLAMVRDQFNLLENELIRRRTPLDSPDRGC